MRPEAQPETASVDDFGSVIEALGREILAVREEQSEEPVIEGVSPAEVRARLSALFDFDHPIDLDGLRAEVGELLKRWTVRVTHPAYFGLFIPPVDPAGIVADTLVAL